MTAALPGLAIAAGPNFSTVLTVGATILVALLAVGSTLGGFAAFKTGRTNAVAASAVARAAEATETATMWKGRVDAVEAEFAAFREQAARDAERAAEALHVAEHSITKLQEKVSTLEGIVTARKELSELTGAVVSLGQTVGTMMEGLRADHQRQHEDHGSILAAIGGRRDDDA